jgi:probable H4MPT-linked C1 transfer pathway protein
MISMGWDIGGVNLKAARVGPAGVRALTRPLALLHEAERLASMVTGIAEELDAPVGTRHGITMTGELSQRFDTKAEGVHYILSALEAALPAASLHVFTTGARFVTPTEARKLPLQVAASNWVATAALLARTWPDALVLDMGSTTTDIVPLVAGAIAATGRTDPERLACGELVYTGALRTPADALAPTVPWGGRATRTAPDGFALVADAHVWLGTLDTPDCTTPMADGGAATRERAGHRLARLICADRTMVSDSDLTAIAEAIADAQVNQVEGAIRQVIARHPALRRAVVLGVGERIVERAATVAGLEVTRLSSAWGADASAAAPAVSVAELVRDAALGAE